MAEAQAERRTLANATFVTLIDELLEEEEFLDDDADILPRTLTFAFYRRNSIPRVDGYVKLTDRFFECDFGLYFRLLPHTFESPLNFLGNRPEFQPHKGRGRPPVLL